MQHQVKKYIVNFELYYLHIILYFIIYFDHYVEYGMGGKPSREGDLYSFGVLVLEMFIGKRPTDQLFVGDLTLRSYVESGLPEHVLDITDVSILHNEVSNKNINVAECLKMLFHVGIRCCEESPTNRMTMAEALAELVSLKERFFKTKRTLRAGP